MAQTFIVVDDHPSVLRGTCHTLQSAYPEAELLTARTVSELEGVLKAAQPTLIVMDLSLPNRVGETPRVEIGLKLLGHLLKTCSDLNFVIQSVYPGALVPFSDAINQHPVGFTIVNKSASAEDMLTKVDWALQGLIYIPSEMRTGVEIKEEWLRFMDLAFNHAFQDGRIAKEMNVSVRTIRHYWTRIQSALEVYPEDDVNPRIKTYRRARELGLIE